MHAARKKNFDGAHAGEETESLLCAPSRTIANCLELLVPPFPQHRRVFSFSSAIPLLYRIDVHFFKFSGRNRSLAERASDLGAAASGQVGPAKEVSYRADDTSF
jgi:hypothetical protein